MIFNKIDVIPILRAHFATLRDNRLGQKLSLGDVFVFACIPLMIATIVQFRSA